MAASKHKKKKKKKTQQQNIENASVAATTIDIGKELLEMRNRLDQLCKIHANLPEESHEVKKKVEESMSKVSQELVDLVSSSSSSSITSVCSSSTSSTTSTSKSHSSKESTPPVLNEEFYQEQLRYLQGVYNSQVDKCLKKNNFATKGWPVVRKAVENVEQKIGGTFEPISKKDTHTFSEEEIDNTSETYFQYVHNIKDCLHAIAVSKDGNCFFDALSKGLNGNDVQNQQLAELRLRGACYYAKFFQTIHEEGFKVGWARALGK